MPKFSPVILNLAAKYGVTVARDTVHCPHNSGASAGTDIYLGKFDDPDIELIAFFHELGHTQSPSLLKRGSVMSIISGEALAWELGLGLAYDNGYEWDYYSKQMIYARRCLFTYLTGETMTNFKNEVEREKNEWTGVVSTHL